jgi:hypothetical protein
VETDRLASPTGEPHDTAPPPDSTQAASVQNRVATKFMQKLLKLRLKGLPIRADRDPVKSHILSHFQKFAPLRDGVLFEPLSTRMECRHSRRGIGPRPCGLDGRCTPGSPPRRPSETERVRVDRRFRTALSLGCQETAARFTTNCPDEYCAARSHRIGPGDGSEYRSTRFQRALESRAIYAGEPVFRTKSENPLVIVEQRPVDIAHHRYA